MNNKTDANLHPAAHRTSSEYFNKNQNVLNHNEGNLLKANMWDPFFVKLIEKNQHKDVTSDL